MRKKNKNENENREKNFEEIINIKWNKNKYTNKRETTTTNSDARIQRNLSTLGR